MPTVIAQLLNLVTEYGDWLYVGSAAVILLYLRSFLQARQLRSHTTFTIEREVAVHRQGRALTGITMMLGVVAIITGVRYYVLPELSDSLVALMEPTPTHTLPIPAVMQPTATLDPDSEPTPTNTPRPIPTVPPVDTPAPTVEPTPAPPPAPPASCPDVNTAITSPGMGGAVSGSVGIYGTANHPQFQFFKVEFAIGDEPGAWNVMGDLRYTPIVGGELGRINTAALPNGSVWFRVTVVDASGNFPPPCAVRVRVQN